MHTLTRNKVNIICVPNPVSVGPAASVKFGSFSNKFIHYNHLCSLSVGSFPVNFQKALKFCRMS